MENSILNIDPTSKSWSSPSNLDFNVYSWPKQGSKFSQSIATVNSHQNYIFYIDRTSWNCNITHLILGI